MTAETIAKALGGRKAGSGWTARCPAHDDRTPSLSLRDADDGKVLVRCHAGCDLCGQSKGMLLPYLTGYSVKDPGHTWLHQECSRAWHQAHRARAVSALVAIGISIPAKFADDFGKNGAA